MAIKECVICGLQFDARGRSIVCSDVCRIERYRYVEKSKARYDANPEKYNAKSRAYYQKNLSLIKKKNAEKRIINREQISASNKARYDANPEKYRTKSKEYYQRNTDRCKAYSRSWYGVNKESANEKGSSRRRLRKVVIAQAKATLLIAIESGELK